VDTESDQADWTLALQGDGDAFGRIFDRHKDRVRRHSHRLVPHPNDAEDVVAITFFEAWRRRSDIRFVDGSALPWLLVIATNSSRNLTRGARRYQALLRKLPPAETAPDQLDDSSEVQAALSRLSLADRQVITLCVLDGFSEGEAALALGVAPGTVKSRLSRAKTRLARQLDVSQPLSNRSRKEAPNES
jgi:RNA polymerase sigma factor (sigma-70 family)